VQGLEVLKKKSGGANAVANNGVGSSNSRVRSAAKLAPVAGVVGVGPSRPAPLRVSRAARAKGSPPTML
jgi:hypothetical protein